MVQARSDGASAGLVGLYNANLTSRNCYAYALATPQALASGIVLDGLLMLLDFAFRTWDFQQVYFEVPQFNLAQFESSVGKYLREEGRLREHIALDGKRWDLFTLTLFRDVWDEDLRRLALFVGGEAEG